MYGVNFTKTYVYAYLASHYPYGVPTHLVIMVKPDQAMHHDRRATSREVEGVGVNAYSTNGRERGAFVRRFSSVSALHPE